MLTLSPHGALYLDLDDDPAAPALPPAAARRISAAFGRGAGAGLIHLGAAELQTPLPSSLAFFRDLGRRLLTTLCAHPALAQDASAPSAQITTLATTSAASLTALRVPPPTDLEPLLERAPPMRGAEYLDLAVLHALWQAALTSVLQDLQEQGQTLQTYLGERSAAWSAVGRVCLHLAEHRRSEAQPFALLFTYASQLNAQAQAQHLALSHALKEYANDKPRLLSLLQPLRRAAEQSPALRALVESGAVYQPQTLSAAQAYALLKDVPALEAAGLVVRVPDFWRARRRAAVSVTIGGAAGGLSLTDLIDFQVALTLDGEVLDPADVQRLLDSSQGLAQIKGRWVEVDGPRLRALMKRWTEARRLASQGIPFMEAMRLLAGASLDSDRELPLGGGDDERLLQVQAGPALMKALQALRDPGGAAPPVDPGPALKATLRPYQREGLRWLWYLRTLGLSGCLADDMGLGKTLQVLALLLLRKGSGDGPALLVVPASLLANWRAEAARFAPDLRVLIAHPSALTPSQVQGLSALAAPGGLQPWDVVVTSYGYLLRQPALREATFALVVLDEAQAIKNSATRQTRAVKALKARQRLALTGTPVENRLGDLWSLFDFLTPGLLGSASQFSALCKRLAEHEDHAPLRRLVAPYLLRRMKTDKRVIADLPDKTELRSYCGLSAVQAALYAQVVEGLKAELARAKQEGPDGTLQRRGQILSALLRLKQVCNHPAQHLGNGDYAPEQSGKFQRLRELCEPIAARQEKVLVFTQFRELTGPLASFLATLFGRPGLTLDGTTAVARRQALVDAFQAEGAGAPPFFVLSLKAGGTGLNLTAAAHVIHFDRWWNPAVEDQATDRAFRIGQRRNVLVHKFVCRGTLEERIDQMLRDKQALAGEVVGGSGELPLTEMNDAQILDLVNLDIRSALDEA